MEEEYIEELEICIQKKDMKSALEIIQQMKLNKMDVSKYEQIELFDSSISKNDPVNKMKTISNRIQNAKDLINDMEITGEHILSQLHNQNEQINEIRHKVKDIDKNITFANRITKRMNSWWNRI